MDLKKKEKKPLIVYWIMEHQNSSQALQMVPFDSRFRVDSQKRHRLRKDRDNRRQFQRKRYFLFLDHDEEELRNIFIIYPSVI